MRHTSRKQRQIMAWTVAVLLLPTPAAWITGCGPPRRTRMEELDSETWYEERDGLGMPQPGDSTLSPEHTDRVIRPQSERERAEPDSASAPSDTARGRIQQ